MRGNPKHNRVEPLRSLENYGGRTWARTKDPLIKSQLLYQLSYASVPIEALAARLGKRAVSKGAGSCKPFFAYQLGRRRFWRSIDIRMPMHSSTVIDADPPKLTSGSGMPTTGARPITISRLIAK